MLKDSTYTEKLASLRYWMPHIIDAIKKDLKNDHLKKSPHFVRLYFPGKNLAKLTSEDLSQGYLNAITEGEGSEELAEFISNRWLLKHSDVYHYFEQELAKINPNFNEIETLEKEISEKIMNTAVDQFGAAPTYLFSILNSVVFPDELYKKLDQAAKEDIENKKNEKQIMEEASSIEAMQLQFQQEIARLTDKYEKKLNGLQKKYNQDTENLKKQIAVLQRKLNS